MAVILIFSCCKNLTKSIEKMFIVLGEHKFEYMLYFDICHIRTQKYCNCVTSVLNVNYNARWTQERKWIILDKLVHRAYIKKTVPHTHSYNADSLRPKFYLFSTYVRKQDKVYFLVGVLYTFSYFHHRPSIDTWFTLLFSEHPQAIDVVCTYESRIPIIWAKQLSH